MNISLYIEQRKLAFVSDDPSACALERARAYLIFCDRLELMRQSLYTTTAHPLGPTFRRQLKLGESPFVMDGKEVS